MNKQRLDLLKRLVKASGVPGFETEVSDIIEKELKGLTSISYDKMGSIICEKKGTRERPKIMLPGHMDEVGFMVKLISEEGFIKFTTLGGWVDARLPSQRVVIKTSKGAIPGVIGSKPPHLMSGEERKKDIDKKALYIDIGAKDKKDTMRLGVKPGDPIIPEGPFVQMANPDYLLAKAWDDRVGCGLFIEVIKVLKSKRHPNTILGVGTTQEEIGLRGARTSVRKVNPDVAIICEVSVAQDVPGGEKDMGALGKGPQIGFYDSGMIPNLSLRDFVISVAEQKKIPYQIGVMESGSTDGALIHIHAEGVPCLYIGVPTRYIHGHAGIIHRADYENTIRLITEVVLKLDERQVRKFSR